jgi:hypothetical protein
MLIKYKRLVIIFKGETETWDIGVSEGYGIYPRRGFEVHPWQIFKSNLLQSTFLTFSSVAYLTRTKFKSTSTVP